MEIPHTVGRYSLCRRKYEAYSDSKYRFAVKKQSSKVSYKILLLSDPTFVKLFFHIFTAIIEALIVAGHKCFVYPPHRMRPPAMLANSNNVIE